MEAFNPIDPKLTIDPYPLYAGLREAMAFQPAVFRVGFDSDMVFGHQALQNFRHAGLTGLEGRRQFRDRPKIAGQAGQVIEDHELGIGQVGAFECAVDPH